MKKKYAKFLILAFVIVLGALTYTIIFYDVFSSCPWRFRFEKETKCWLRDERMGVKLIELYDLDLGKVWLAKVKGVDDPEWIEHPYAHGEDLYNKKIDTNTIRFSDGSLKELVVNGNKITIKKISKE